MMPSQLTTSFGPEDWAIGHRAIRARFALEQDEADAKCKLAHEVLTTPYQRATYILREVDGWSHRAIALQLGKSEIGVRLAVSRARRDIARHLHDNPLP